ncbi:MAG: TPM domain-containing protein [Bacteroidia bacterium]|jgi:uncharacterized protein
MRYHWDKAKFLLVSLFLFAAAAFAQTFPEKSATPKLVNDFADILSADEERLLETKLVAFDDSTSTQITIVSLSDLDGEPASSYAPKLAEAWGVGDKQRNNGIMILVSMDNPREVFIATGYGVEEFVTDGLAKRIINEHMLPAFKQQRYYDGLNQGSNDLMQLLKGTFKGFEKKKKSKGFPALIVVAIVLFVIFASRGQRGGGFRTYGRPGWGGFPMGGGGWHSGGGRSSSGGGFGGFGGGSFGGGGAGGSW